MEYYTLKEIDTDAYHSRSLILTCAQARSVCPSGMNCLNELRSGSPFLDRFSLYDIHSGHGSSITKDI